MERCMTWVIPEATMSKWLAMADDNAYDEVRLDICAFLIGEANKAGKQDVANCFKNMESTYSDIRNNHLADGSLNYFNECARIGCDERLKAMVRFFDADAAREIGRII